MIFDDSFILNYFCKKTKQQQKTGECLQYDHIGSMECLLVPAMVTLNLCPPVLGRFANRDAFLCTKITAGLISSRNKPADSLRLVQFYFYNLCILSFFKVFQKVTSIYEVL